LEEQTAINCLSSPNPPPPRKHLPVPSILSFLATISLAKYPNPSDAQDSLPRGGRLSHFADNWSASNQFLGSVLASGVEARFLHDEPPAPFDHGEPSFSEEMNALVDLEVASMKAKLAILEIPEEEAFLICKMFLVAKKGGGFRPVLNLRPLNRFTVPKHFKMEGLPVVKETLRPNDWMCSVDLSDAFFHVPLHPNSQKYFQFRWRGKLYQYRVCPFGWSRSPQWFQALTRHITSICRREFNFRLVCYLDDFLMFGTSKKEAEKNCQVLLCLLRHFGFSPNLKKTRQVAAQRREFLGMIVDSVSMELSIPEVRLKRYRTNAKRMRTLMLTGKDVSLQALRSLVGQLQSCEQCFQAHRLRMGALLDCLRTAQAHGLPWIPPCPTANKDLDFWIDVAHHWNGRGIRVSDERLTTDAGPDG
jgi:hypothetical protein